MNDAWRLTSFNVFGINFLWSLPASNNWTILQLFLLVFSIYDKITKNKTLTFWTMGETSIFSLIIWFLLLSCFVYTVPTHLQHWAYFRVASLLPNIQFHITHDCAVKFLISCVFLSQIPLSPFHPPKLGPLTNISLHLPIILYNGINILKPWDWRHGIISNFHI